MSGSKARPTDGSQDADARRVAIIRLLETMNDGLPTISRHVHTTPGFVNEPRSRTCPDCIANGRVMKSCDTCHGSGQVTPRHLDDIALPDVLPGDGDIRDPYAVSAHVQPYGVRDTVKFGHVPARDAEIERARQLGKDRPANDLEIATEATPYVWERERAAMYRRFDYAALDRALDVLREHNDRLAAAVVTVYTYRLVEPSTTLEAAVEAGLRFIDRLMPDPIRAPGTKRDSHPASARIRTRAA